MIDPMYHHSLLLPMMLPALGPALARARRWLRKDRHG